MARPRVVNHRCFFPGGGCFQYQSTTAQFEEFSRVVRLKDEKGVGVLDHGAATRADRFDIITLGSTRPAPYRYFRAWLEAQLRGLSRQETCIVRGV